MVKTTKDGFKRIWITKKTLSKHPVLETFSVSEINTVLSEFPIIFKLLFEGNKKAVIEILSARKDLEGVLERWVG